MTPSFRRGGAAVGIEPAKGQTEVSSPTEPSGNAIDKHDRGPAPAQTAARTTIARQVRNDVTGNFLDSAVAESILTLRLRQSARAQSIVRLATIVLSLWFVITLCWVGWAVLAPGGNLGDSFQPWVWFWAGCGAALFAARAWLADRRDARLREAAHAWMLARSADLTGGLPAAFRDAFCRSDRVLDLLSVGLLLTGAALALMDGVRAVASYVQAGPVVWQPTTTLALVLMAVGTCVLSVSGHQGRRRALELRQLPRSGR